MFQRMTFIVLFFVLGVNGLHAQQKPTEVLVVGTIHGDHLHNPHYTYYDLADILYGFQPDAIGVEIKKADFRKKIYLREMELASVYGLVNNKPVYPIDWGNSNIRKERKAYQKTEEYKEKQALMDSLLATSPIMQKFREKYGNFRDYSRKQGCEWWQSQEYNDYFTEYYHISMKVYGDHCMNLLYRSRNDSMMSRIKDIVERHPGKRVAIFTGAEHKHYFDSALSTFKDVDVLDFSSLDYHPPYVKDAKVEEYLLTRDPSVYIDNASAEHRFSWIRTNLKVLVHHFGMDFRPYEIPQKNVDSARFVLNSIDPEYRSLPEYHYEKGWLCFLEGDYKQAIAEMEKVLADSSRVPEDQKWQILSLAYRNMGFCYDMTGNRSDAIAMYNQGKETSGRYGSLPGKYIYALFDRWIEEPYKHQETANQ